ncbi:MAG: helix-turn-helix transcriptional regulator [Candidatus Fimivivens sp.]|nr:helix-turn-helix transcriptional regulator [Candidatus Fimivivens sp.]
MNTLQKSYEVFADLLERHNITPYRVYKETGVPQSSLSEWKRGNSMPKIDKMQKLAEYFGVSVDYLLGKEEQKEKEPDLTDEDRRDIAKMLDGMVNQLGNHNVALMFDGEPVDEETKELLKISLENQFRLAKKLMQKRKSED